MKHSKKRIDFLRLKAPYRNKIIALVIAISVFGVGFAIIRSGAAGFLFATEAEQGAVSDSAVVLNDPTASGGKAIQFKAAPTTPPPTTPPPVGLKGWQINPTNVGLAPHGLSCASLPEYNGPVSNGNFKPAAGSVISKVRISKPMNLSNGNITIEKSCIRGGGIINEQGMTVTWEPDGCGNSCTPGRGPVTIRDSEFDGSNIGREAVSRGCAFHGLGFLERNYIHDLGSGLCFVNTGKELSGSMVNNYIHKLRGNGIDPGTPQGSHNEAGTIRDFPTNSNPNRTILIANNMFDSKDTGDNDSGAFFIQPIWGEINNATLEGNLFVSGNFNLTLEAYNRDGERIPYGRNMRANNNRFDGGYYGPHNNQQNGVVNYGWAEAKENYINDPSKPDNKGRALSLD